MNGLASVIIVTYNHKKYIEPCINSVAKQNYPHEIIAVDNCSEDGSNQLLREKFPDIKLIENTKNIGFGLVIEFLFILIQHYQLFYY